MSWFDFHLHLPITDPTWIFLLVLIIILFAPILLSRLRIPHIIGMILAGIVVGEFGLNILERDSSFELFGKVGLYYIMFLAGLEMDLEGFKKNRMKAFVFGLLTFLVPVALGLWSSLSLLNYGLITSILLASVYGSHTLIAYPIVSRYGLSRLRSVSITVGATALSVAWGLFVLAIISGMYKGGIGHWFWIILIVKILTVCMIIIFSFPRIGRWFFRRYNDGIMQFIFVLVLVFLGCALLELTGMEGILGAFVVGLVLNRLVPNTSPLMNRLEFVGNALFIPYFLIGVGMIIDLRTLFSSGEALKVAVVMTLVATVGKWLAAWMTQKIFRMQASERGMMFGLSNAQAAATLAVVLVGNKIEIAPGVPLLNDDVLNGSVVMILFTCIISSMATEHASRKIAVQESFSDQDDQPEERENILIPVANPETIDNLINMALIMRDTKQGGLTALSVINDNNASDARLRQGKHCLEHSAKVAAAADVMVNTVARFDLNIASGIIHAMKEYNASEVVVGLHHKVTLVDSFLGTLTENLLKGTHKQVMIVKCLMPVNTLRRVVVAVPPKAEYEAGFFKWVERISRMGVQLGCRVHFFANAATLDYLKGYISRKHKTLRREFSELATWDDLLLLTGQMNFDHLLVIVSARRGFISYDPSFDKLPSQITRYFNNNSLIVLYPDQYGDPQETLSFSNPVHHNESRHYDSVGKWFYKWFKKN